MATQATLESLFGGKEAAKVLLFIENYGEGYASWIARNFAMPVSEVQKQLRKFEESGVLVIRMVGTSRMYTWNLRDPALEGLKQLLQNTLEYGIPDDRLKKYFRQRGRPRRKGKPLRNHGKGAVLKAGLFFALSTGLLLAAPGISTQASAKADARQITLFMNNCVQCHARADTGAPRVGVAEDWQDAVGRGEDAMLVNTVQGIRGMPPLGYCSACSEDDLRVIIRMMTGISDQEGVQ